MIIDIHAHTSERAMVGLHTVDASLDKLEREIWRYGMEKIVLMATYFPLKGTGLCNAELLRRLRGRDKFVMFGSLDVENNFAAGLAELRNMAAGGRLSGIKLYPGYQDFDYSDLRLNELYAVAERYCLPVAVHTGELHYCCPAEKRLRGEGHCGMKCLLDERGALAHPGRIRVAAAAWPSVTFIMCHLGNPYFDEARAVMAESPNIVADISGQFVSGTEEASEGEKLKIVNEIQKFLGLADGRERILFGSDFPIQSYADSIELVERLDVDLKTKRMIYRENARRILERRKR